MSIKQMVLSVFEPTRFESLVTGKPVVIRAYHWAMRPIKEINPRKPFYFCDDLRVWGDPSLRLYEVKITLKNPLVVLNQKAEYEHRGLKDTLKAVAQAGYDSVIYTPRKSRTNTTDRQGVVLSGTQVKSIREIPNPLR